MCSITSLLYIFFSITFFLFPFLFEYSSRCYSPAPLSYFQYIFISLYSLRWELQLHLWFERLHDNTFETVNVLVYQFNHKEKGTYYNDLNFPRYSLVTVLYREISKKQKGEKYLFDIGIQ